MKIGLDVLGGDYAPQSTIQGAIAAQKVLQDDQQIVLFGDEEEIKKSIEASGGDTTLFEYVHAPENISMHDHPTKAISKNLTRV
jgi:glycerol-3-phosphate acyltransferase PlsX